jgi:hypothetical protein
MENAGSQVSMKRNGLMSDALAVTDDWSAFTAMKTAFAQAANIVRTGFHDSYYRFAGQGVRARIVGDELAEQFTHPFAHLETSDIPPPTSRLIIDLWDEEVTGIPCPVASAHDDIRSKRVVGDGVFTASPDGRFVGYHFRQSMTWLDRKARHIVGWTASGKRLSLYERGKPLHLLLSVWYHDQDMQVIHAGMVSRNGQGVLFPGMGGSGKSTSTLACLSSGFDYLGDDYIGLQASPDSTFMGHSIYNSTWLEPDHMAHFPLLSPHAIYGRHPGEDKCLILLSHLFPKQLSPGAQIRVLALPRIADASTTRFFPASRGDALLQLAPSSLLALAPRPGVRGFQILTQLVKSVPSYRLELGRDLTEIPRRVKDLLTEVARP